MQSSKHLFKLLLLNTRSISNNWHDIQNAIRVYDACLVAVTETLLSADKDSCVFSCLNYHKFTAHRQRCRGRGVMLLINPALKAIEMKLVVDFTASCDCVIVKIISLQLILALIYRPL